MRESAKSPIRGGTGAASRRRTLRFNLLALALTPKACLSLALATRAKGPVGRGEMGGDGAGGVCSERRRAQAVGSRRGDVVQAVDVALGCSLRGRSGRRAREGGRRAEAEAAGRGSW